MLRKPKNPIQHWQTPKNFYKLLHEEFEFDHDPCPLFGTQGLDQNIPWGDTNFCNPPFDNIKPFAQRCRDELINNRKTSVLLVPVRSDTAWFHDYVVDHSTLRFVRGRLSFLDQNGNKRSHCAFPVMLCIFSP